MLEVKARDVAVDQLYPVEPAADLLLRCKLDALSVDDLVNLTQLFKEVLDQKGTLLVLDLRTHV